MRSGSSPPSRRSPATTACWRPSWPSRSTTRAAAGSTCTCPCVDASDGDGRTSSATRRGAATGCPSAGGPPIAGVLAHAPALAALLNPTINSYKRFGPDTLAPWLIDWGLDNRSAMVRIPPERGAGSPDGGPARRRHREPLPRERPRVGAAAYLGVRDGLEPPAPLEGYGYDPSKAQMLPQRLTDALDALEADTALHDVLGEHFVTSFLAYKRNEVERFERHVTDWEFREYAYHL